MIHGSEYLNKYAKEHEYIDFSVNINPIGVPEKIRENWSDMLRKIEFYPLLEYKNIKKFLTDRYDIKKNNILPTNGISEGIFLIFSLFRPERTLIACPCYSDYIKNAVLFSKSLIKKKFDDIFNKEFNFSKINLFIFGSPNNPDSKVVQKGKILELIKNNPEVLFVVDQSFIEFCEDDELNFINNISDNLIVLYSFTKFFSIPGLRLGAIIAGSNIIEYLKKYVNDWNVNSISEASVEYIIDDYQNYKRKTLSYINKQKKNIILKLSKLKEINLNKPKANFFLIKVPNGVGKDFFNYMLENKIILRKCGKYDFLSEDYFRFCINSEKNNNIFCEKVVEYFSK